jgi:hypothetical protein
MEKYRVSFAQWLKSKYGRLYLVVSTILTAIYSTASYLKMLNIDLTKEKGNTMANDTFIALLPFIVQIIFILFVVLLNAFTYYEFESIESSLSKEKNIWGNLRVHRHKEPEPPDDVTKEKRWIQFKGDCNKSAAQFVWFWLLCWVSWLAFYITLTFAEFNKSFPSSILNLVNNVNAVFFIFLFMTLSTSTSGVTFLKWLRLGLIVVLIFLLEITLDGKGSSGTAYFFSVLSGLLNGLAMASFVGSINSRALAIPIWVLLLLTLYPAIQPLYFMFADIDVFTKEYSELFSYSKVAILVVAFFLKVLLFLLVTWILQTGRLMHFMAQEGSWNYDKKTQFNKFVENAQLRLRRLL